ncbi:MAG: arginine--tRNA ligase, partial [Butyrivibrio sp.]|nr:arginine--tRNA ligase [Butyrivibrio sp.]
MEKLIELISKETGKAFAEAGYDEALGKASVSNRPDLCEFQCNGAMAGAKQYHKAPYVIAEEVAAKLQDHAMFEKAECVKPGFLNLTLSKAYVRDYAEKMTKEPHFGLEAPANPRTILIDYGGPNVAKPLHVGHLRTAVIGEAMKRILRYKGEKVTGDIHMGDWGLQMGLIIAELAVRNPDLPYFDKNFKGDYPKEAPFTVTELEEIYPSASAKSKEDADFKAAAMEAT